MNNNLVVSIVIVTYKRINRVIDILEDLKLQSFKILRLLLFQMDVKALLIKD